MHNVGFLQISHILIFSISFWPIQILMYGVLYWFWCTGIISRPNRLGVKNVLVVVRDPAVNWLLSCVMVKPSSNIILLEQDEHWSPFKSDLVNPPRWPPQRPWSPVAALWSLCLVFAVFTDLCWLCCVQWQCVDLVLCCVPVVFDSGRCNLPHGHQFSTAPSRGRKRAELIPTEVLFSYLWLVLSPFLLCQLCISLLSNMTNSNPPPFSPLTPSFPPIEGFFLGSMPNMCQTD